MPRKWSVPGARALSLSSSEVVAVHRFWNNLRKMPIRDSIRALRLYYRSFGLFRKAFRDHWKAWLLPLGSGAFHSAKCNFEVWVPRHRWSMLPSVARLVMEGFEPRWTDSGLAVRVGKHVLLSPPMDKSIAIGLREVFVDDVYGIQKEDLDGRIVLDIGAHIGDSTIAFAARGARVHAFEPVPVLQDFLRRNVQGNDFDSSVAVHPVGLSDSDKVLEMWVSLTGSAGTTASETGRVDRERSGFVYQKLRLVDAVSYLRSQGILHADVLKVDCEGCEYVLFSEPSLLQLLRPRLVVMEFHEGCEGLRAFFAHHGYRVESAGSARVGYLRGVRQ
jgi:FkbM family methyltransferase